MSGRKILAPTELRSFVRAIQYVDLPPPKDGFVIPAQGRSTLLLPEHTEYSIDGEIAERLSIHPATVVGPHDAVIVKRTVLPVRVFTVDFTPLGAIELLGVPQGELANRGVAADQLLPQPWVRELVDRVNQAPDVPTALSAIHELLYRAVGDTASRPDTTFLRRALFKGVPVGEASHSGGVQHIAQRVGVSPRHVNREFHRHFGMGPQRYGLIARIQRAITLIADGHDTDLSNLALDLGFFDHSHFSTTFKRLTLTTPSEFADSLRHRVYKVFATTPRST